MEPDDRTRKQIGVCGRSARERAGLLGYEAPGLGSARAGRAAIARVAVSSVGCVL